MGSRLVKTRINFISHKTLNAMLSGPYDDARLNKREAMILCLKTDKGW